MKMLLTVFFVVVFAEDGELRRTLQSLACGKARVLVKKPKVLDDYHCPLCTRRVWKCWNFSYFSQELNKLSLFLISQ